MNNGFVLCSTLHDSEGGLLSAVVSVTRGTNETVKQALQKIGSTIHGMSRGVVEEILRRSPEMMKVSFPHIKLGEGESVAQVSQAMERL